MSDDGTMIVHSTDGQLGGKVDQKEWTFALIMQALTSAGLDSENRDLLWRFISKLRRYGKRNVSAAISDLVKEKAKYLEEHKDQVGSTWPERGVPRSDDPKEILRKMITGERHGMSAAEHEERWRQSRHGESMGG